MNQQKILLVNIDSKIPNLALAKIGKYYRDQGYQVEEKEDQDIEEVPEALMIYASCVFTENRDKCKRWEGRAVIGGSGYDIGLKLPEEMEAIKPRINLGFTTRGCIRKCQFCIVPKKEGSIEIVGDLYDLWDGKAKMVTLLDNNILARPDHFEKICEQARENKIKLDHNQGLDHRLLTEDIVKIMKRTSHRHYKLAFDHPDYKNSVDRAITLLQKHGIKQSTWYVLCGYNTTFQEDLDRLNYLRDRGQAAYVQRYERLKYIIPLARWANQHHVFKKMKFEEFIMLRQDRGANITNLNEVQWEGRNEWLKTTASQKN